MLESRLPERFAPDGDGRDRWPHPHPGDGRVCRSGQTIQGRWSLFVHPSSLQLAPLLDRLLEPIDGESYRSRLRLGLQEVLVNAVSHGNGGDAALRVRIRRIECRAWWVFQVQDEGTGVPIDRRCASLPGDLHACAGRGLFLIHQCFEDVRWSARGNRLQVAARRQRP